MNTQRNHGSGPATMPAVGLAMLALTLLAASSAGAQDEGPAAPAEPFFRNVAAECGLDITPAQRVAFVDIDGDGYADCALGNLWKEPATKIFLSETGGGTGGANRVFRDFTAESRIAAMGDDPAGRVSNLLIFADVDNDGDSDAFSGVLADLLNPDWKGDPELRSAIFLNDGQGHFEILEESGVHAHPATTCAATFFDANNDGRIDLFVGNWYRQYGKSTDGYQDRLYAGTGKGKFRDITAKAGLETVTQAGRPDSARPVYGAGHCDVDGDGWQDILVCAYGRQWNMLWLNDGKGGFTDVGARTGFAGDEITHGRYPESVKKWFKEKRGVDREDEQPYRSNGNTFSVACGDYDGDGDMDLFLGEITHAWAGESSDLSSLLINRREKKGFVFERVADAAPREHSSAESWNQGDMHVAWLDFDNDGRLDLLVSSGDYPDGQYLRLFRQRTDHSFEDVTAQCGFDWEGSSGISVADFDRDGDLDILAGKSWMRLPKERCHGDFPAPALFRNDVGNRNDWITVRLKGKGRSGANASGIGARITVRAGGVEQIREIRGGSGHCGQFDPPEAHFGLGKCEEIESITVRWPNRKRSTQTFRKVEPNRVVRITEGGKVETLIAPDSARAAR